jgi:mono/diheme cytochrome c family protein
MLLTNRSTVFLLSLLSLASLPGCSRKPAIPPFDPSTVQKTASRRVTLKEVQVIFSTRCIACHAQGATEDGSPMGGMILTSGKAASQLINVQSIESPLVRVYPGDLAKSYLYHKLHGTFAAVGGLGLQMPLSSTIPPEERALIDDWILSGAPVE